MNSFISSSPIEILGFKAPMPTKEIAYVYRGKNDKLVVSELGKPITKTELMFGGFHTLYTVNLIKWRREFKLEFKTASEVEFFEFMFNIEVAPKDIKKIVLADHEDLEHFVKQFLKTSFKKVCLNHNTEEIRELRRSIKEDFVQDELDTALRNFGLTVTNFDLDIETDAQYKGLVKKEMHSSRTGQVNERILTKIAELTAKGYNEEDLLIYYKDDPEVTQFIKGRGLREIELLDKKIEQAMKISKIVEASDLSRDELLRLVDPKTPLTLADSNRSTKKLLDDQDDLGDDED